MDNIDVTPSKDDFLIPTKKTYNTEKNFYSSERGQYIVNALTGERYNHKVGSQDERKFWRVTIPFTKDGVTNSVKLFYISPSEYEYHRDINIETHIKMSWNRKKPDFEHVNIVDDTPKYTSVK